MYACMDDENWMHRWVEGRMDLLTEVGTDVRTDGWTDGCMDGIRWMNVLMCWLGLACSNTQAVGQQVGLVGGSISEGVQPSAGRPSQDGRETCTFLCAGCGESIF